MVTERRFREEQRARKAERAKERTRGRLHCVLAKDNTSHKEAPWVVAWARSERDLAKRLKQVLVDEAQGWVNDSTNTAAPPRVQDEEQLADDQRALAEVQKLPVDVDALLEYLNERDCGDFMYAYEEAS